MAWTYRKRAYRPPNEAGRLLFGKWAAVPSYLPILCPAFLPTVAALSPRAVSKLLEGGSRGLVNGRGWTLDLGRVGDLASVVGPFAVKTLLVAYAAFTARPDRESPTVSVPVWDVAPLFGLELPQWSDRPDGEEYRIEAARLKDFSGRVRDSVRLLKRIEVRLTDGTRAALLAEYHETRGNLVFSMSPTMGKILSGAGIAFVPEGLFRLPGKERTAFAMGLKIASYASIRRNHTGGRVPDRLRVRTLLESTPLAAEEVNAFRGKASWRLWTQDPFERAMTLLRERGILSAIGYAAPMCFGEFKTFDQWAAATVVYRLPAFPEIEPPKGGEANR